MVLVHITDVYVHPLSLRGLGDYVLPVFVWYAVAGGLQRLFFPRLFCYKQGGTVVITGASTGIGRVCAEMLAVNGFTVYAGVRSKADYEDIAKNADEKRIPLKPLYVDVTNEESVKDAADLVAKELGYTIITNSFG